MDEYSSVDTLKGIGEKTRVLFEHAGIRTIQDLLHHYPRGYDVFEEIVPIRQAAAEGRYAVYGMVASAVLVKRMKGKQIVTAAVKDESGVLNLTWFNMPYLKNTLKKGAHYVFRGRVAEKNGRLFMEQPAVFGVQQYEQLVGIMQPVYPLTAGLTNNMVSKAVRQAFESLEHMKDYLPGWIRQKYHLAQYGFSLEQIHFPKDEESMMQARRRLVFDEFFQFILAVNQLKTSREAVRSPFVIPRTSLTSKVAENLGYELTNAQKRVWEEIQHDMSGENVMARLIQGDVGSGKTIIAFLALFMAADAGCQGCLMVPTEVLAAQHFAALTELIESQGLAFVPVLLTGSMTAREKRLACEKIKLHQADIIVGTHALIQEKVEYDNLGLVITDEQHRFGVRQREALAAKGSTPHTIVMSATPIPRTLAVILYGDLDISVIDELPSNRLPIKNCVVNTGYRPRAYQFIQRQVDEGRQAYIICPMVEESEMIEAEDVISYTQQLKEELAPSVCVEYLHGKMKPKEKNAIMERFLSGEIHVLVSTTVVEVGVNVPNATVMMVENAERFGLAQLHQLRGRVGRGKHQSFCIFMHTIDNQRTQKRLEILNHSNDGFYIAEEDLKLRGPGDIFGIRQSGLLEFKIADVFNDAPVMQEASEAAAAVLAADPQLDMEEHRGLKRLMEECINFCNTVNF
ncbi:ATP-dependent DNA helicase RecG [Murimonas intestini]|uniref:ATP-dependent DNA helicase RecG n=1 Tax=Murimonas intestini TaxID=1337051 RepID=UPI0011DD2CB4|nr:ATP-dependent DNA helicase RecG [Murimonas intestini]